MTYVGIRQKSDSIYVKNRIKYNFNLYLKAIHLNQTKLPRAQDSDQTP